MPFRVAANTTPDSRRGALTLESTRLEVRQDGVPCRFDLDTTRVDVESDGGAGRIGVTTLSGCAWTARALDSWISLIGGESAIGSAVVQLSVAANDGPARQGTVTVAGQNVTVAQQGFTPPPAPTPPPTPTPPPPSPTPTPTPTPPSPSPTPSPPAPPPTPSPGEGVELDGRVSSLGGSCPNLTFTIGLTAVYTDVSTKYREGNCMHVQEEHRVIVVGQRQSDGRVQAWRIDIKQRK